MKKIKELIDLKGRKALVTGGVGHIGHVCCEVIQELGGEVKILDLPECDLRGEEATRNFVRQTVVAMNGLDIFIHSAAYVGTTKLAGWAAPFENQTVSAWEEAQRVNVTSAFVIVQEAKKVLEASGYGSVILLDSIYGVVGPDMRLYEGTEMHNPVGGCVSKGALLQLMRYLATFLAPKVRVNAISPGGIWRNQPESFQERYVARTPLKRMGREEDVKGAIAYLASDLSRYVTGHNLLVDGGWTIW
ncbi:MAG: short-chain dehydrogenase [Deltaproteobacteria bacterium RIFCSPLOWO2_12_FULL_44_12]|nr:MAG: short-chain dehydrogenase [Deltaproteobacteria bacterium RIFCSPHIGHO2_01_FULL_43_49]OGQ16486.1 MAG: short-chain dehydrogenase [Deltaproteobacteria bacterium RIFCSPHIGHO2_02_FULL_44_53]OGQ29323.1 MAG: short-chain dehydrogenase [Deltaproteobacteria bacterium RIFCSPHIGHO2_12_FULL_44_21]OGQ33004.1 MAG: short-chain dehydrogenase [Deltaproteobacteria bacterium RIFCSPLOWO2_01_FULL_45_74]OGQ42105.1 MAG: short-chain dehydrogenase [Deltaproteobacteria bacterium RIFCSPLOWO2_02_FULL_44_34]OGQ71880